MTEAAHAALIDGFDSIQPTEVFAWTVAANLRSQRIMCRIGMRRKASRDFDRPALADVHPLRRHVVHPIRRKTSR
ncbi:hypothetical protein QZM22_23595 [Burkholderia oklahomensis]|uniref:hypothetical protein n=1 Tax=Burkholderia oklahomensis TaxID=342113 RepID=UPI002655C78C|nr:hypothetical protein [Burkholderia oklahomensis]MDN7675413.1 hypothetical protein [Burkholderia oklahomensis]